MARILAWLLAASGFLSAAGQQSSTPQAPTQPIGSGVSAIVVDVVVRDAKGRPVTDLTKEDFELREEGVVQSIGDVTVVGAAGRSPREASRVAPSASSAASTTDRIPPIVPAPVGQQFLALVFDRLSPDARPMAYKGALACLDTLRDGDYVGVFVTDLSLITIQTYTNDRAKIREALFEVATRASSAFDRTAERDELRDRDERGNLLPGDAHPSVPVVASPESVGRPVDGRTSIQRLMDAVGAATHSSWEMMARDQQGYATTNGLLAISSGLGLLPGRKSVIFFAEGMTIPDTILPHFRNVVANANRANVSVYSIDSAGLRVHSKDAQTAREVVGMGLRGLEVGADGSNLSSLAMLERNEDMLRSDPRTSLSMLAEQTGGFLIDNTNDLASGFKLAEDDRRFHYLVTYTPSNANFDGKWRRITVTVPNRRVSIRARSGYLAVPGRSTLPLLAYEGPALAALDRSPAPADVPIRSAALVFPGKQRDQIVLLASINAGAIQFDSDAGRSAYRTDFTILARVRGRNGEVVKKASQPYRLSGSLDRIDQAKAGDVLFFRQPSVEPGSYTLEVAVHDALSGRVGVGRTSFVVPDRASSTMNVGSLVLVRRAERVKPDQRDRGNRLYVGDILVYPSLGEPFSKSRDKVLTFLTVLVAPTDRPREATLDVLRADEVLARVPVSLASADAEGRIENFGRLPLGPLPTGRYTLRFRAGQGDGEVVRTASFELID